MNATGKGREKNRRQSALDIKKLLMDSDCATCRAAKDIVRFKVFLNVAGAIHVIPLMDY